MWREKDRQRLKYFPMKKIKLTNPPVANLRRKQAATDPSNCAIQYKIALNSVMFPPRNAPNVTAGFTWPPEMLAPTDTATKSANACTNAAATSPEGVDAPPSVSLSAKKKKKKVN